MRRALKFALACMLVFWLFSFAGSRDAEARYGHRGYHGHRGHHGHRHHGYRGAYRPYRAYYRPYHYYGYYRYPRVYLPYSVGFGYRYPAYDYGYWGPRLDSPNARLYRF